MPWYSLYITVMRFTEKSVVDVLFIVASIKHELTRAIGDDATDIIFIPPPLDAGGIMFSGCPSVHPSEAWNTLFWPVHGSVCPSDQPWPFTDMSVCRSVCPSVRPERFPGICRKTHGGNGLKFYMQMYLDRLQNWLVYGHGLLIF